MSMYNKQSNSTRVAATEAIVAYLEESSVR